MDLFWIIVLFVVGLVIVYNVIMFQMWKTDRKRIAELKRRRK